MTTDFRPALNEVDHLSSIFLASNGCFPPSKGGFGKEQVFSVDNQTFADLTGHSARYVLVPETKMIKGSSSTVHLAYDNTNNAYVALKVIARGPLPDKLITKELEILQNVKHENIILLLDIHVSRSEVVLATPYLSGGDLLSVIPDNIGLSPALTFHYAKQLFSALAYLHQKGFTHGDVKCENVLLKEDKRTIVLCDFGMSENVELQIKTQTADRVMGGTPAYMCPLLLRSSGCSKNSSLLHDKRPADIWSAGIVLHCVITGRLPWAKASLSDTTFSLFTQGRHRGQEAERWAKMPKALSSLLYRLLSVDINRRWSASQAVMYLKTINTSSL